MTVGAPPDPEYSQTHGMFWRFGHAGGRLVVVVVLCQRYFTRYRPRRP